MKALVLGTGSIGRRHIANVRALCPQARFEVVRREGRVDALTTEMAAGVHRTVAEALDTTPDFAVVATPSALHGPALQELLAAGIPVYVEKPVVTTRTAARALEATLATSGPVPTMAGCNLRFLPSLMRVRALVREGAIGRVVRAHVECGQWLPDWRASDYRQSYSASAEDGGGVVLDLIHELDSIRWILGDCEVLGAALGHLSDLQITSEDTAVALLRSASGTLVSVGLDYVARQRIRRYEFVGTRGTIVWDFGAGALDVQGVDRPLPPLPPDAFDVGRTYVTAMAEFIGCVGSGAQTTQPLAEGLASLDLALTCKEVATRWL